MEKMPLIVVESDVHDTFVLQEYNTRKKVYETVGIVNKKVLTCYKKPIDFYRKLNGYGISIDVMNEILKRKVKRIVIQTREGFTLESSVKMWYEKSVLADKGRGPQYYLNINLIIKR